MSVQHRLLLNLPYSSIAVSRSCLAICLVFGSGLPLAAEPPVYGESPPATDDIAPGTAPSPIAAPVPAADAQAELEPLPTPKFDLKIGGILWSGYDSPTHESNGARHAGSTGRDRSGGFRIERAYLNFAGKANDGPFKEWSFRVTSDITQASDEGDGCLTGCTRNNDLLLTLKYAYFEIPLPVPGKVSIRVGEQQTPLVDGQAGASLERSWGRRYIARAVYEELGLTASADRGISLLANFGWVAYHGMIANGEGFRRNNAQRFIATATPRLSSLARGDGDSDGLDFVSLLTFMPVRNWNGFDVHLHIPFRLSGIYGIDREETHFTAVTLSGTGPRYQSFEGDARAKRDQTYGAELAISKKFRNVEINLGGGRAMHVDQRSTAYLYDATSDPLRDTSLNHIEIAQESRAWANYGYLVARWGMAGVFGRYIYGTSGGPPEDLQRTRGRLAPSQTFSAPDGRPWEMQALIESIRAGGDGNFTLSQLRNRVDSGLGRMESTLLGLELHFTRDFSIAVGGSQLVFRDGAGREGRVNGLQRLPGVTTADQDLARQLESDAAVAAALGYAGAERPYLNDTIGSTRRNATYFIRARWEF